MADHVWSVLCDRSVIDKDSNQVSLLNVIERIRFFADLEQFEEQIREGTEKGRPPALPHEMHLVTWWVRSNLDKKEEVNIRVVSITPQGERGSVTTQGVIDLANHDSYRMRIVIGGILYRGNGRYWLVVEYEHKKKWVEAARLPVVLSVEQSDQGAAESDSS